MQKISKKIRGITLISLVVTIIVLLILAGIAISLTVGNNGLFSRAGAATNTWRNAELNEHKEIKNFENIYDETLNNLGLNSDNEEIKKEIGDITGNEKKNIETTDKNGNRIVVPAGFKVINPEETIQEGIVIEDVSANDINTVGNQFVWIPCEIENESNKNNEKLKYDRYAFEREDWGEWSQTKLNEKDSDGSYKIQDKSDIPNYYHEAIINEEIVSIEKYGGFYIGRYEVGCETERNESDKNNIIAIAKIKPNLNVYNYVTRDEANTIAQRIYNGKSKLCSSYAWDTALKFIGGEYAINSEGDNYNDNENVGLKNTGYHAKKNIYDMGGNVCEWTTESYTGSNYPYVRRGGVYYNSALDAPAGSRYYSIKDNPSVAIGIRTTLYL